MVGEEIKDEQPSPVVRERRKPPSDRGIARQGPFLPREALLTEMIEHHGPFASLYHLAISVCIVFCINELLNEEQPFHLPLLRWNIARPAPFIALITTLHLICWGELFIVSAVGEPAPSDVRDNPLWQRLRQSEARAS